MLTLLHPSETEVEQLTAKGTGFSPGDNPLNKGVFASFVYGH